MGVFRSALAGYQAPPKERSRRYGEGAFVRFCATIITQQAYIYHIGVQPRYYPAHMIYVVEVWVASYKRGNAELACQGSCI